MEAWMRTQEILGDRSDAIAASRVTGAKDYTPEVVVEGLEDWSLRAKFPTPSELQTPAATPPRADAGTQSSPRASTYLPPAIPGSDLKWTSRYLRSNPRLAEVVATLLELAYLPPGRSLRYGTVSLVVEPCCAAYHTAACSLVVRVRGVYGWAYEFTVSPSTSPTLFRKYALIDTVQDNWFVLTAIFRDQHGIKLEEDYGAACGACKSGICGRKLAVTFSQAA